MKNLEIWFSLSSIDSSSCKYTAHSAWAWCISVFWQEITSGAYTPQQYLLCCRSTFNSVSELGTSLCEVKVNRKKYLGRIYISMYIYIYIAYLNMFFCIYISTYIIHIYIKKKCSPLYQTYRPTAISVVFYFYCIVCNDRKDDNVQSERTGIYISSLEESCTLHLF